MRFFKENSYDVVRLYVNQFGITIFSLILYFSASIVADEAWRLTIYLFHFVFLCADLLHGVGVWREGPYSYRFGPNGIQQIQGTLPRIACGCAKSRFFHLQYPRQSFFHDHKSRRFRYTLCHSQRFVAIHLGHVYGLS